MGQTMSVASNKCKDEVQWRNGQPGINDTDSSNISVQTSSDIVIGKQSEASDDSDSVSSPVLGENGATEDELIRDIEPEKIDECDAATETCTALDKTIDTTPSVYASDEEAGGSLASLDEEKAWDPFGLSLKDGDAEDIAKSIRMLRRRCLAVSICIGLIALVGGLATLTRDDDVASKRVFFANSTHFRGKKRLDSGVNYTTTTTAAAAAKASGYTQISFPPSLMPTAAPIIEKYSSATNSPSTAISTDAPTQTATNKPSHSLSSIPSQNNIATDEPTVKIDPPSPQLITGEPTNGPSSVLSTQIDHTDVPKYDTFSFYVTGDSPYSPAEEEIVKDQLAEISELVTDEDMFLFHVGDLMRAKTTFCQRSSYQFMEDAFTQDLPNLPVFLIPGDNDWNDCPDPDLAWQYWEEHFMAFEQHYMGVRSYLPFVDRQLVRQENLSYVLNGVLLLGLNQVGGFDDANYEQRLDDNQAWVDEQVIKHENDMANGRIRLCVIFIHSAKGSRVFRHIKRALSGYSFPTLFFKGDGHTFLLSDHLRDVGQPFGWHLFQTVQVDQGGKAPPIKITVQGTTAEAFATPFDVDASDNSTIFWNFVRLDRRGGVYSNFVENDGIDDE